MLLAVGNCIHHDEAHRFREPSSPLVIDDEGISEGPSYYPYFVRGNE